MNIKRPYLYYHSIFPLNWQVSKYPLDGLHFCYSFPLRKYSLTSVQGFIFLDIYPQRVGLHNARCSRAHCKPTHLSNKQGIENKYSDIYNRKSLHTPQLKNSVSHGLRAVNVLYFYFIKIWDMDQQGCSVGKETWKEILWPLLNLWKTCSRRRKYIIWSPPLYYGRNVYVCIPSKHTHTPSKINKWMVKIVKWNKTYHWSVFIFLTL